ncbi:phosphotransferase [Leisingera daeponensis]|uniref:phosphotransferase n=1 Tax=Leisingera daeponensis TaxID=405746 RepID=UPI001C98D3CF|nr:phosphotransferase [Leisingera daeponensis]MBY6059453.1 aminoglycoside phosphotransferase family protein [Leisingera daeponensis]
MPELVRTASQHAHSALPSFSTMIHGDLHLKNMVAAPDTDNLLLLDPRLQWDAEPVDRFGYGDPVYDIATLLHSIGGMATILRAIETGTAVGSLISKKARVRCGYNWLPSF